MPTELLMLLVKLAMDFPQLADSIKRMVKHEGVTDDAWEDAAHIIAQNPDERYFKPRGDNPSPNPPIPPAPGPTPVPNGIYDQILQSEPSPAILVKGDRIGVSSNGAFYWVQSGSSTARPPWAGAAGWSYFGYFDGERIVRATEANDPVRQ